MAHKYHALTYPTKKRKKEKKKHPGTQEKKLSASPGGLEPAPTFRLTAERANQLRHGDGWWQEVIIYFLNYRTLEPLERLNLYNT